MKKIRFLHNKLTINTTKKLSFFFEEWEYIIRNKNAMKKIKTPQPKKMEGKNSIEKNLSILLTCMTIIYELIQIIQSFMPS